MGRQSSRILIEGYDAKQVVACDETGTAYDIDQIWMNDADNRLTLLWEKLKSGISWIGYENSGTFGFVKYNGSVFLYIDDDGNLYTSNDAITWNVTSSPYASSYILHSPYLMEGNGKFICGKKYRYIYDGSYKTGYQLAISTDGINWDPINSINVIYSSSNVQTYRIDNTDGKVPYFKRVMYANGKYFTSSYGFINDGTAYSENLIDWYRFNIPIGDFTASSIEAVSYIDGYYYFGVSIPSNSYVVRTKDLQTYEKVFAQTSAKGIWSISKCGSGIVIRYLNDLYYSEDGRSFKKIGETFIESTPSVNDNMRAYVSLASNEYVMINANYQSLNEYEDVESIKDTANYNEISISEILEYTPDSSRISVILVGKVFYVFLNQESKVISLIGTMEG